jgi:murein DD-endopeptidase MepM/ murein hydrolase activator NlpD
MQKLLLAGLLLYASGLFASAELFHITSKEQLYAFAKLCNIDNKTTDKILASNIKIPMDIVTLERNKTSLKGFIIGSDDTLFDISLSKKKLFSALTLRQLPTKPTKLYTPLNINAVSPQEFKKISDTAKIFESKSGKKITSSAILGYNMSVKGVKLLPKIESIIFKGADFIFFAFVYEGVLYDVNGIGLESKEKELPVDFERISDFYSLNRFHPILHKILPHYGIDLVAKEGKPVYAVMDGSISELGYNSIIGNYVKIRHINGFETIYGHLQKIKTNLKQGDNVAKKDVIGLVGHTGLATGAHLHFGVKKNGADINPIDFYGDSKRHVAGNGFFEFAKEAKQRALAYASK